MTPQTIRIAYDDGVISGSATRGWLYLDDSGDWRPIGDPFGPLVTLNDNWEPDSPASRSTLMARIRRLGYDVEIKES